MGNQVLATQSEACTGVQHMSGELTPVPSGADKTDTFQYFQQTVQSELDKAAKAAGKPAAKFDLSKAQVFNRAKGDGSFELTYSDEGLDFFCGAQVNWKSHEILIRSGKISEGKKESESGRTPGKPVAGKWIDDACTATEKLAGKDELVEADEQGKPQPALCKNGVGDPRLEGIDKYESVKEYEKQCRAIFDDFGRQKFGIKLGDRFDLKRARLVNPFLGDGTYSILFENRANNFFCEGVVDSNTHNLMVQYGGIRELENEEGTLSKAIPMTDACTMTKDLLGKEELVKGEQCVDRSATERGQESKINLVWNGFLAVSALWGGWKMYRKFSAMPRVGALFRLPLVRNLGWGAFTYLGYDAIASNWVPPEHWARKYGSPIAGGIGLAAPEVIRATGLATRLSSIPAVSRLSPIASRATLGLALVWGMNKAFEWGIGSDYKASIYKRVTDQVYDKHVYELDGWDFLVLPLALKGIRASSRFIAPDAMNWAVSKDNDDLVNKVIQEDKDYSEQGEQFMREIMPQFLFAPEQSDRDALIAMLRKPAEMPFTDIPKLVAFKKDGASGLRAAYPNMSDEDVELFARKAYVYQIQDVAKNLVFIDQELNGWAREVFNSDGTLKGDEESLKKIQERWPNPYLKKAELNSHDLELSDSLSHYG